jgi:hypothetical protein
MEAKDKAVKLVDKYWNDIPDIFFEEAKQCAIIAVDEIINTLDSERIKYSSEYCFEENNYWKEVKQEIEKL